MQWMVAEKQLAFMGDMQKFAVDMKAANKELLKKVKEISAKQDAASGANLAEIAKLMGIKSDDMKACMVAGFESLTAQIVKQFDKDVGPYRLIDNPTFRYIWKNYLVGSDHISRDTFIGALKDFWQSKKEATANGASVVEDGLFSEANVASLMNVIDKDCNGKVFVAEVNMALVRALPERGSESTPFEDIIGRLVEAGKQQVVAKLLRVHLAVFDERRHELEAYTHPFVIKGVPGNLSLTEYVEKLDNADTSSGDGSVAGFLRHVLPEPLMPNGEKSGGGLFESFLTGSQSLFLLLGDPGSGKSLFSWQRCKLNEGLYRKVVKEGSGLMSSSDRWIPVAIDLKNYSLRGVKGLLRRYLKQQCKLSEQELSVLQGLTNLHPIPTRTDASVSAPLRLLVFCDGFDELRVEPSFPLSTFSDFSAKLLDGLSVDAKVFVTCQDRYLKGGRAEENRIFRHAGQQHVRRVLLPLRASQIDEYIERWTSGDASTMSVGFATPALPSDSNHKLPTLQYQVAIRASASLQQIVRNPFVLRLFVDALPHLCDGEGRVDVSSVTRYAIYSVFVRQYVVRQLKKWRLSGGKWVSSESNSATTSRDTVVTRASDDELIADVELLCAFIAGSMFNSNTLMIQLEESNPAWASLRDEFFDVDSTFLESRARADWNALRPRERFRYEDSGIGESQFVVRAVRDVKRRRLAVSDFAHQLCPLRKTGDGFSFLHKSFYEYFLAALVLGVGSDPLCSEDVRVQRMARVLECGRGWQSEPDAIYFLCDKWWAPSNEQQTVDVVQATRRCLFSVVQASAGTVTRTVGGDFDKQGPSASSNAATLLNWLNEPFSGVQWDGVQLAGADLSCAVFVGASLRGANLSRCLLKKVVLSGADVTGATLEGANFAERAPVLFENMTGDIVSVAGADGMSPYVFCLLEGVVKVCASTTGSYRVSLYGNSPVLSVAALEGYVAGVCDGGSVVIWETVNFQRVWNVPSDTVTVATLGKRDGQTLLCTGGSDGSVAVWDVNRQVALSTASLSPSAACSSICVDDTCNTAAVGCESGDVYVLDVMDAGALVRRTSIPGSGQAITAIALSPFAVESQVVAACLRGLSTINMWKCNTGDPLHTLSGHTRPVGCLAFAQPVLGRPLLLASGSEDNECRLWDIVSGLQYGPSMRGNTRARVSSLAFESGEQGMLVSVSQSAQRAGIRFRAMSGSNAYTFKDRLLALDMISFRELAGEAMFVSVDRSGGICKWTVTRGQDSTEWALIPRLLQRVDVVGAAVQTGSAISIGPADASITPPFALRTPDGAVSVWRDGSVVDLESTQSILLSCFVGLDRIATASGEGVLQVWSASTSASGLPLKALRGWDSKRITSLVYSEGPPALLACSSARVVCCWDLDSASDDPVYTLRSDHGTSLSLCFGPAGSGQLLAVGVEMYGGNMIKLYSTRSGTLARVLAVQTSDVTTLSWLSASRLACRSADCVVRVWDVGTGICLQTVTSVSKIVQLACLASVNVLVGLCDDGIARVWDGTTSELVTQSRSHHRAGPFASELRGLETSSGSDLRLLETGGFDAEFSAVCSAVMRTGGGPVTDAEQLSQALAHRLSLPSRDAFQRAFLRHIRSHGLAEGLDVTLLKVIELSKMGPEHAVSAGNAASCLNWLCSARPSVALSGQDWGKTKLIGADFRGADLSRTRFEAAELIDCDFSGATLAGTDFSGVDLLQSSFVGFSRKFPGSTFGLSPPGPDGSALLASVVDKTVISVWRPDTGECVAVCKGQDVAPDVGVGRPLARPLLHRPSHYVTARVPVTCLTFGARSDGRVMWASDGSGDYSIRLWNVESGGDAVVALAGHTAEVTCLCFGTLFDGKAVLASGSNDHTVRIWNVETGDDSVVLGGHADGVTCLCFVTKSDGGLLLASGSRDCSIRLWSAESSDLPVISLQGHTKAVTCLTLGTSPDGRLFLASGSDDLTVRLWEVEAGGDAQNVVLQGHIDVITCLCFGTWSDGRVFLASGSRDHTVRLWSSGLWGVQGASTARVTLKGHTDVVTCMRFSTRSDGRTVLASGSCDRTVRVWDVEIGDTAVVLAGHTDDVTCLSLVPHCDGKTALASGSKDRTVKLWNVEADGDPGELHDDASLMSWDSTDAVVCLSFITLSHGRAVLASGSKDCTARLWHAESDDHLDALHGVALARGHTGEVVCVEFAPQTEGGALLASGAKDNTVRLWDIAAGGAAVAVLKGHTGWVKCISFGTRSGGKVVLASGGRDSTVRVWDVQAAHSVSVLRGHTGKVTCLSFGTRSGGKLLLASGNKDKTVRLWDAEAGGKSVAVLRGHTGDITCICFCTLRDGKALLASGSRDNTVRLWDVEVGGDAIAVLKGHSYWVKCLSFSSESDGRLLLASGSKDTTVRLWDVGAGGEAVGVLQGHTGRVTCLSFGTRSDGKLLLASGSKDKTVKLWDVGAGGEAVEVLSGNFHYLNRLSFWSASDGRLFLAAGDDASVVRLWDVDSLSSALSVQRFGGTRPEGSSAATFAASAELEMSQPSWALEPAKPCFANGAYVATIRLRDSSGNTGLAVSPDGTVMVVSNENSHKIGVYRLPDGAFQAEFGGNGSSPGHFNGPWKLCFTPAKSDSVLIADCDNNRVQVCVTSVVFCLSCSCQPRVVLCCTVTFAGNDFGGCACIGEGIVIGVYGVAASADVIVAGTWSDGIMLFDQASGSLIRSLVDVGKAEGQLYGCDGMRFTPDGSHIVIAEQYNNRLSLFTRTGDFVRCIGVGRLGEVRDVDFASSGDLLVADRDNHRICVFSADGATLVRSFGLEGDTPGKLRRPFALAAHGGKLFVLDGHSARVQVFN